MSGRLTGKTCLVTAAAQGIGHAIAAAFLREGADVIAVDLKDEGLGQLAGARAAHLDATDATVVAELASRFQQVSVLVNCVGHVANSARRSLRDSRWADSERPRKLPRSL